MTLIIGVATEDYIMMVSDRRLTSRSPDPPHKIAVEDDDTCKLVALCGVGVIGYTGPARIAGIPTHEWIAVQLASNNCRQVGEAVPVLTSVANRDISTVHPAIRKMEMLLMGWSHTTGSSGLRPVLSLITNMRDAKGDLQPTPGADFRSHLSELLPPDSLLRLAVGARISTERGVLLTRNFKRLSDREIGPTAALRLLMEEVIFTAATPTVGKKVLGCCIPKGAAESFIATQTIAFFAGRPGHGGNAATFAYFEEGYDRLRRFGPTFCCGPRAIADFGSEDVSMRILRTCKPLAERD